MCMLHTSRTPHSHMDTSVARCCDIDAMLAELFDLSMHSLCQEFLAVSLLQMQILKKTEKALKALILARGLLALESCVDANYQLSKGFSAETSGGLLVALPSLPSAQAVDAGVNGPNLHKFSQFSVLQ